jgi:hypothetical protein
MNKSFNINEKNIDLLRLAILKAGKITKLARLLKISRQAIYYLLNSKNKRGRKMRMGTLIKIEEFLKDE